MLALGDELSTGLPLDKALIRAADGVAWLSHTSRAAAMGGDIPQALRDDAARHDQPVLASLSAAWQVAAGSGGEDSDARLHVVVLHASAWPGCGEFVLGHAATMAPSVASSMSAWASHMSPCCPL